jgi:ribosome-binding protein aMBF1 (putative translation factor)
MEENMKCEICNSEINIYEINETVYVEICRKCIDSTYKEGFRKGFKLAGGR